MADAWCYACGREHTAPRPRGRNCKNEPQAGFKHMPTRRTSAAPDPKGYQEEVAAATQEEINQSLAEIHPRDKFATHQEYLDYLEELDAEQVRQDAEEEL